MQGWTSRSIKVALTIILAFRNMLQNNSIVTFRKKEQTKVVYSNWFDKILKKEKHHCIIYPTVIQMLSEIEIKAFCGKKMHIFSILLFANMIDCIRWCH